MERPVCPWCDHIVKLNKEREWECEHCHMVFRHWDASKPEPVEKKSYSTEIVINLAAPEHFWVSPSGTDCWCTIGMLKELKRSDILCRKIIEKLTVDNGGITPGWILDLAP